MVTFSIPLGPPVYTVNQIHSILLNIDSNTMTFQLLHLWRSIMAEFSRKSRSIEISRELQQARRAQFRKGLGWGWGWRVASVAIGINGCTIQFNSISIQFIYQIRALKGQQENCTY